MADHAGRVPGKIQVPFAFDQLLEGIRQCRWITTTNQLLRQDLGGVRQSVVGARLDVFHSLTGVKILQVSAREGFAVISVHGRYSNSGLSDYGRSSIGTHFESAGPS